MTSTDSLFTVADRDELIETLHVARESLIEHVTKLPLNKRDHAPALVRIDAAINRLAEMELSE